MTDGSANQGRTVDTSLVFINAPVGTAGVYVPMTRGRHSNQAFVVADGQQTAVEVLGEALAREWIDQPAIVRRDQLSVARQAQAQAQQQQQVQRQSQSQSQAQSQAQSQSQAQLRPTPTPKAHSPMSASGEGRSNELMSPDLTRHRAVIWPQACVNPPPPVPQRSGAGWWPSVWPLPRQQTKAPTPAGQSSPPQRTAHPGLGGTGLPTERTRGRHRRR